MDRKSMIPVAGTIVDNKELIYVKEAALALNDPKKFNYFIKKFERDFASYVGAKYAWATPNGTSALHLCLLSLGIGKGDEVILPDLTYIACANVVSYVGATPVLVDVNRDDWCLSPEAVGYAITKKTKAIMPVWMYGNYPKIKQLLEVANGIPIIEDACPAVGATIRGKHAGTFGACGAFSFQGAKTLAIGEGGMYITDDENLYKRAKKFATHFRRGEFDHDGIGYEYEMNNVSAALGLAQLERIRTLLSAKKYIYNIYKKGLNNFKLNPIKSTYWMSSIITDDRDGYRKHLKGHDIETRPFFTPISQFGLYEKGHETPNSYYLSTRGINLPSACYLNKKQLQYVVSTVNTYYRTNTR